MIRILKAGTAILLLMVACACASVPEARPLSGEYLAGRFAARVNDVSAAAAAYDRAAEVAGSNVDLYRDAFFFSLAAGDIPAAGAHARRLVAQGASDDHDELAALALAVIAVKSSDLQQARMLLGGPFQDPFLRSIVRHMDAWALAAMSGVDPALARLDAPPEDVFVGFDTMHRGLMLLNAGRAAEASDALQAAAFGLGGSIARSTYGAFLEREGQIEIARAFYTFLLNDRGGGRRAAMNGLERMDRGSRPPKFARYTPADGAALALFYFAAGSFEQSVGQRMRAVEAGFAVGEPRYHLPLVLSQLAIYLNPSLDEARRLSAAILNSYEDYDAAAEILAAVPRSSDLFEQARVEIAAALIRQDRKSEAASVLRDVIARDRNALEARLSMANLYAEMGRHDAALRVANEAVERLANDPAEDSWRYFVVRGAAHLELGQWEAAERDLKRAVEIAPDEPTALNYLGYSWAERGLNLEAAFELIDKAVSLRPNSGAYVDSLGWANFQLGRYEVAAEHLERAVSLEPADATIAEHLGDTYWRLSRPIEARYQWRRALELEPAETATRRLMGKLSDGLAGEQP